MYRMSGLVGPPSGWVDLVLALFALGYTRHTLGPPLTMVKLLLKQLSTDVYRRYKISIYFSG